MGLEELEQKDYFSIGDVRRITGVPEYSVRYWEAEFGLIRPVLIYKHKLTLEGAKKQLSKYQFSPSGNKYSAVRTDVKLLTEIKEALADLIKE